VLMGRLWRLGAEGHHARGNSSGHAHVNAHVQLGYLIDVGPGLADARRAT
jgi:hypothetical protein